MSNKYEKYYDRFYSTVVRKQIEGNYGTNEVNFNKGFILSEEGYKKELYVKCREALHTDELSIQHLNTGKIYRWFLDALAVKINNKQQNLVGWRDIDKLKALNSEQINMFEKAICRLFCLESDEDCFNLLVKTIGQDYPVISFIFFLKDKEKYLPVRPKKFKDNLKKAFDIDADYLNKCSWENYCEYLKEMQNIRGFLSEKFNDDIELLDAHSFVWMVWTIDEVAEFAPKTNDLFVTEVFVPQEEGLRRAYYTHKYERNAANRKAAIKEHGYTCAVCGINLEEKYGELGHNFIEVHHIKPLYTLEQEMIVDPRNDLVCLCPNCHRMIHRRKNEIVTVEELKAIVNHNS